MRDQPTRLNIFDHSIELINPRRTAGFSPVAQKAIRYGVPQRLNPQLAAIFSSPAYGGQTPPGGLPMLLRASRLFSDRRTELNAINDEFRLRLHGSVSRKQGDIFHMIISNFSFVIAKKIVRQSSA